MHLPIPPLSPQPTSSTLSNLAHIPLYQTLAALAFLVSIKRNNLFTNSHQQSSRSLLSFSNSSHHRHTLGSSRKHLRLQATMTQNPKKPNSTSRNPILTSHPFPTPQSLFDWLRPRLPSDSFASWGIKPGTKNVHNLWLEIADGETSLIDTTPPVRSLEVVSVRVLQLGAKNNGKNTDEYYSSSSNLLLIESHQELSDGSIRERGRPLSEKMKAGEDIESAARRGIKEELGSVLLGGTIDELELDRIVKIVPESYMKTVEQGVSKSYPGLPACYVMHTVDAFVEGLPKEEFVTEEGKEYGDNCSGDQSVAQEAVSCKKHFWRWVPVD